MRNKRLELAVRNAACDQCKLHTQADEVCITGTGPNSARVAVVTKFPMAPESRLRAELESYLDDAGIDHTTVMWLSALKCQVWDMNPSKGDQKACAPYLRAELDFIKPDYVLCLGSEAWFAASGWANITQHRGKLYDIPGGEGVIFPTISPAAVARNPGMRAGFVADLRYFARLIKGEDTEQPPFHNNADRRTVVTSRTGLRAALRAVRDALAVSYDIETTGAAWTDDDAAIVSIAVTVVGGMDMHTAHTYEIPMFHPESVFRDVWRTVVTWIVRALQRPKHRIAHNAKFDTKWLRFFSGIDDFVPTFDTIIALALLDENQPKGLKPASQSILGADPWGIDTRDLLTTPLDEVLEYNGLDTWHTLRLYFHLREQLIERPRTARLFQYLMMPAIQELIGVEMRGVYVDRERLTTNWNIVKGKLEDIEDQLWTHIPEDVDDWPPQFFHKRTNELQVNWNPSNFCRWFLFEHLGLPVLARGKAKEDGRPGDPSMAEALMMVLADMHPVARLLLDRVEWNKFDTSFFRPWSEQLDADSRIHSTFKPWGTVTGRLSSGKEDAEKITAGSRNRKGVNLQQVPRNKLARGVFGAAPGYVFVEADYSQIELRIAAYLAREGTMLRLYQSGQDIHMAMAMRMTGKPASEVTPEERKRAKAVNFGFLYGMGWRKFIATAWANYGLVVSEEESVAFRKAFFDQFPKLLPWHARQRRLAYKYGRVETPMGRVRNLPDIYSPDDGVRAEAERQAINSPVQGFASDMALLSLVHTARAFRRRGIDAHPIGTVHDAVNFEVHRDDAPRALPIIKRTMETLPLERMFGVVLDVPIIADIKVGTHWGGATPLEDLSLLKRPDDLAGWIEEVIAA